ncbi:MAG: ABC transporter substrate-binding protein, partial [Bacillota bacterium]|nr:ABC transporter substrate-binding protein [Bacillota bacterium]
MPKLGAALLLLIFLASASSCGSQPVVSSPTLVVANWKGYGSDLPWAVEAFEKKTGAKVIHQYINSDEELVAMVREGGLGKIDVI